MRNPYRFLVSFIALNLQRGMLRCDEETFTGSTQMSNHVQVISFRGFPLANM